MWLCSCIVIVSSGKLERWKDEVKREFWRKYLCERVLDIGAYFLDHARAESEIESFVQPFEPPFLGLLHYDNLYRSLALNVVCKKQRNIMRL